MMIRSSAATTMPPSNWKLIELMALSWTGVPVSVRKPGFFLSSLLRSKPSIPMKFSGLTFENCVERFLKRGK